MDEIIVVDAATGERLPGIPTPRLVSVGEGEAFFVAFTSPRTQPRGAWYLHVPGSYENPTGEYRQVRVVTQRATVPCDDCFRTDGTHNLEVEH